MAKRGALKRLVKNFGGWPGLFLGLYFLAAFGLLVLLLAQAVATDVAEGLFEVLEHWLARGPLGALVALALLLLLPGIVVGISRELTRSLYELVWWTMRKMDWNVSHEEFWEDDSWTWIHLVGSRAERPLTPVEASSWWLCRHSEGPVLSPVRAAMALQVEPKDVRNALTRAERKMIQD